MCKTSTQCIKSIYYLAPISNVEIEATENSRALNKMKGVVSWYSASVFAIECFLARNCQSANRSSQLEPTKVHQYFIEYHLCYDGIPLTALESYPPLYLNQFEDFAPAPRGCH